MEFEFTELSFIAAGSIASPIVVYYWHRRLFKNNNRYMSANIIVKWDKKMDRYANTINMFRECGDVTKYKTNLKLRDNLESMFNQYETMAYFCNNGLVDLKQFRNMEIEIIKKMNQENIFEVVFGDMIKENPDTFYELRKLCSRLN